MIVFFFRVLSCLIKNIQKHFFDLLLNTFYLISWLNIRRFKTRVLFKQDKRDTKCKSYRHDNYQTWTDFNIFFTLNEVCLQQVSETQPTTRQLFYYNKSELNYIGSVCVLVWYRCVTHRKICTCIITCKTSWLRLVCVIVFLLFLLFFLINLCMNV